MFIPVTSALRLSGLMLMPPSRACRHPAGSIPSRRNTPFVLLAMPTTFILRLRSFISFSRWRAIWSRSCPPTVPVPQRKTLSS